MINAHKEKIGPHPLRFLLRGIDDLPCGKLNKNRVSLVAEKQGNVSHNDFFAHITAC